MNTIISLSGKKHSGKTTLAERSLVYGFSIVNFSDSLKNMLCFIMKISRGFLEEIKDDIRIIKLTHENLEYLSIETNIDILKFTRNEFVSVRDFLQYIGTDIIRNNNPDWHVHKLKEVILKTQKKKYCIADCRFKNEKKLIETELNGICYYIERTSEEIDHHVSENELSNEDFKHIIYNNLSYDDFIFKNLYLFQD